MNNVTLPKLTKKTTKDMIHDMLLMPRLSIVTIQSTAKINFEGLKKLNKVKNLGNLIIYVTTDSLDLSELKEVTWVKYLTIINEQENKAVVTNFECLSQLESVTLENVEVKDYSELASISSLNNIRLNNVNEDGMEKISELSSVDNLVISNMQLYDIDWIQQIQIAKLSLDSCDIETTSQLGDGSNITCLSLIDTNLDKLSEFKCLNHLRMLDLSDDDCIVGEYPFSNLSDLNTLIVGVITEADIESINKAPNLKHVSLYEYKYNDYESNTENNESNTEYNESNTKYNKHYTADYYGTENLIFPDSNIDVSYRRSALTSNYFEDVNYYIYFPDSNNSSSNDENYLELEKRGLSYLYEKYCEEKTKKR